MADLASQAASTCPSCGTPGLLWYEGLSDRHYSAPGSWCIRRCSGCELAWIDPRPLREALESLYDEYYTHAQAEAPSDRGERTGGFERFVKRAIPSARLGYTGATSGATRVLGALASLFGPLRAIGEHAVMWLPAGRRGRLLDVGCGSGAFLEHMRELGWDVSGVESDARAAQAARERLPGVAIHAGISGEGAPGANGFDAITLSHVLEHLDDPQRSLADLREALRPGGWLVIATPNAGSLARRRFGASWLHWDPPRHLQIYQPASLRALIEDAGLHVRRLFTSAGSAHFVWSASWRLAQQGRLPGLRLGALPLRVRLRSLGFWVGEHLRVRLGSQCGEELVAIAERPESEGGGGR